MREAELKIYNRHETFRNSTLENGTHKHSDVPKVME